MNKGVQLGKMLRYVILLAPITLFADAPSVPKDEPNLPMREDTSRFEISPRVKKIDIIKTADMVRVIVKASAQTECYKQREIERIFERDTVKVVLRLKKGQNQKECSTAIMDYEEKVYESSLDLAPAKIWILGYEGWHKLKVR